MILFKIGLVKSKGYPAEEHYLTTEDGYKLVIHRIPGSQKFPPSKGKPIVLLQHGFLGSSDFWVIAEGQNNLGKSTKKLKFYNNFLFTLLNIIDLLKTLQIKSKSQTIRKIICIIININILMKNLQN